VAGDLSSVRSYALYYGWGGEEVLATYDLAIIAAEGHDAEGLKRLRQHGTLPLAYVGALETPMHKDEATPDGVLTVGGVPWTNAAFGNWVLDPRAPATRRRLLRVAEQALLLGCQGLFLDTLGDVEDLRLPPALRAELLPAAANLIAELRRCLPGPLVQNWGLQHLLPLTAPMLDGVSWEAFPYRSIKADPLTHSAIRNLHRLQADGVRVLALNEGLPPQHADYSWAQTVATRCQFLWYGTSRYIDLPQPCGAVR
jgi:hypothetical protein